MSSASTHPAAKDVIQPEIAALESHDLALEVVVIWGERSVLHVEHLSPPRAFWIGEEAQLEGEHTDFLIGRECLGAERLPVALLADAGIHVVVPHGATCVLEVEGRRAPLEQLVLEDRLAPCPALAQAVQFVLPRGATARVEYTGFSFVLKWTRAARPIARDAALEPALKSNAWTLASIGVHLAMLLLFYMVPPRSAALSYDADGGQARRVPFELLAPEKELELPQWVEPGTDRASASGAPAESAPPQPRRKPKPGDAPRGDDTGPAPPMRGNPDDAANAGIISVLRTQLGMFRAPALFDGANAQAGTPDGALAGVLNGYGSFGGIAAIGVGRGAGNYLGGTIDSGGLNTVGDSKGRRRGDYGVGGAGLRAREPKDPPPVRTGRADVRGSLSKEVISRVIHRHLAEVRFCYEQQLIAHPDLQGRVAVKFIIAPDGSVKTAAMAGSDLGSAAAEQCVVQAVQRWTFPTPEGGGIVIVTYPFMFAQTGN